MSKEECLQEQFALFRGIKVSRLPRLMKDAPRLKWIRSGVQRFKSHGLRVIVLSDNPTVVSNYLLRFGFDMSLGSTAIVRNGVFTGKARIVNDKLPPLIKFCKSKSIDLSECIHVGDWNNDIPVFEAVGLPVAINPKNRQVSRSARIQLRTDSMLDVYRRVQPFLDGTSL